MTLVLKSINSLLIALVQGIRGPVYQTRSHEGQHSLEPRRVREENTACDRPPQLRLIKSVHLFAVPRQVAGLREGPAASGAGVGAIAGMGAHVCREAARRREGLAASDTDVGAIARMGAHVPRQVAGLRAGLAAGGACVGAVAGMGEIGRASCRERV